MCVRLINRKRQRYDSGEDLIDPSDLFSSGAGGPFATSMGGMGGMNMGFDPELIFNMMHGGGGGTFSFGGSGGPSPFGASGNPFGAGGSGGPFGGSSTGGTRGRTSSTRGFPPGTFPF